MVEAERITDPSLLQESDIIVRLSNLSSERSNRSSETASQPQPVTLALLQPLANADMLEACRNPNSRITWRADGTGRGPSSHEFLNIQPLSKAWRQALMKVPPISQLTFDLTLPRRNAGSNGSFRKVYWDDGSMGSQKANWETTTPQEPSLGVLVHDIMTLVITVATGTRMRADGDLQFEVIYDETEGIRLAPMALLKKQLLALAQAKAPGLSGGNGER